MHKDKYNIISLIFLLVGIGISFFIVRNLDICEKTIINEISIYSSVLSFVGFIITILQLIKISSNAVVHSSAVNSVLTKIKSENFSSSITSASSQITLIKKLIEVNKMKDVSGNLEFLRYNLSVVVTIGQVSDDQKKYISEVLKVTKEIETKAIFDQAISSDELTTFFGELIELQSLLNKIKIGI